MAHSSLTHLRSGGERMPRVEGSGQQGCVWISDAECEARFYGLSVDCPKPVLKRIKSIFATCEQRNWICWMNQGNDYCEKLRQKYMDQPVNETINAVERFLKKSVTELDHRQDADTLRTALLHLQTDKELGKIDTSTWTHVQKIRAIIGTSGVEETMSYEQGMLWYGQPWMRRHGKDR
ncbi:hypothetical protein E8E11_004597 [Didymella keratinophila]|nr:hypothetical protein E8E11_004597 [Didymella keratinophila]